ncbi:hypothetical protein FA95DRAFT_1605078 [Auriscalpium vulgare]|uniref:Uncharacterized protein n=1 Tax=Auriscalpium vulgare TaxID=40419 RepID=A0ACB8RWV7_9AGAM|nr:hypothetical protein FA95DRAFT_1605078 [Auriscalpium vulgare]
MPIGILEGVLDIPSSPPALEFDELEGDDAADSSQLSLPDSFHAPNEDIDSSLSSILRNATSDTRLPNDQEPATDINPDDGENPPLGRLLSTVTPRKRVASVNIHQYAQAVGRELKLRKPEQSILESVGKLSDSERSLWLVASMLKVQERLDTLLPPEAIFVLPQTLQAQIDTFAFTIIMSPALSAYIQGDVPIKLLMNLIEKHPEWGLPSDAKHNKNKMSVVLKRIQSKLTERRFNIKGILSAGIVTPSATPSTDPSSSEPRAVDIVELCQQLVAINKAANLKVTVKMCARVAFLRTILKDHNTGKYWLAVDKQLEAVREKYAGDATKTSRFFALILENDRKTYGRGNMDGLSNGQANDDQAEADGIADAQAGGLSTPASSS